MPADARRVRTDDDGDSDFGGLSNWSAILLTIRDNQVLITLAQAVRCYSRRLQLVCLLDANGCGQAQTDRSAVAYRRCVAGEIIISHFAWSCPPDISRNLSFCGRVSYDPAIQLFD